MAVAVKGMGLGTKKTHAVCESVRPRFFPQTTPSGFSVLRQKDRLNGHDHSPRQNVVK